MAQESEISGTGCLEIASRFFIEYNWTAYAYVCKYDANSYDDVDIEWPVSLYDKYEGSYITLNESEARVLGYHDGLKFVSFFDALELAADYAVDEFVHEMEYDYEAEAGERADRAYDEWRDRQWEDKNGQ